MAPPSLPPILVVDDNHDNAEIIRQYLEVRGYPVTVAHSGDEALSMFEKVKPALVLLDVMMPGRDGYEVLAELKADPRTQGIPVVLLTARSSDDDVWEGWKSGADYYITKPFNVDELLYFIDMTFGGPLA